jgi:hypothetical protein
VSGAQVGEGHRLDGNTGRMGMQGEEECGCERSLLLSHSPLPVPLSRAADVRCWGWQNGGTQSQSNTRQARCEQWHLTFLDHSFLTLRL